MIKKRYIAILLLLFTVTFIGCTKDKEIILANNDNEQLELQEKDVRECIELGNNYLKQGKYDNAKEAYENAISKDSANKENYIEIKDRYVENSRFDDAFYIIKLAINNNVDIDNMKKILEEIKKNFQVISLEDTVEQNATFRLPEKITIGVNEQQLEADISWNASTVNTSKAGTFTYEGIIDQYGRIVNQKLIITPKKEVSTTSEVTHGEIYKNDKLGFSINFPDSWKGKYTVKENDDGIRVFFKPINKNALGGGFLFGILKRSDNLDESTFDTVSRKTRYFNAKGIAYVVGGPTDVNFDDNDPEFNVFLKMSKESGKVVETLKNI